MAIKILITLEGSEQVKTALDDLSKSGEQFMSNFKDIGTEKTPLQDFSVQLEHAKPAIDNAREATHGFREALHILHPVLRAAGLEVQSFSGFARVASAGLGGLAAAITGAVAVGLASLEESAQKTRAQLAGLFGSKELGGQAFAGIQTSADNLGTTINELAPIFQSATTALQRFIQTSQGFKFVALKGVDLPTGVVGNIQKTTDAVTNLIKIIRAGGKDEGDAEKAAKAFFDTIREGGKLTAEALKQMDPGAIRLLAEAMGRGAISSEQFIAEVGLAPIPLNRLFDALGRFGKGAQDAFDATAVKSFKDEMQGALNSLQKGFKDIAGISFSDLLSKFFKGLSDTIKTTSGDISTILSDLKRLEKATSFKPSTVLQIEIPKSLAQRVPESLKANFKEIPEAAKEAMDETTTIFKDSFLTITTNLTASPFAQIVKQLFASLPPEAQAKISEIVATANELIPKLRAAFEGIPSALTGIWQTVSSDASNAASTIANAFQGFVEAVSAIWETIVSDAQAAWQAIVQIFTAPFDLSSWQSSFDQAYNSAVTGAQSAFSQIASIFSQGIQFNITGTVTPIENPFGFASGGLVRGPGTGTSDSILARLSDREFIMNAKAVSFYGADLLHALNSLRLPRNVFEGFSMGGLVDAMARSIPRFADGGQVDASVALAPVTIVLGNQKFGLAGNADTIKALSRFAVNSRLSSGGRKPSWVGSK